MNNLSDSKVFDDYEQRVMVEDYLQSTDPPHHKHQQQPQLQQKPQQSNEKFVKPKMPLIISNDHEEKSDNGSEISFKSCLSSEDDDYIEMPYAPINKKGDSFVTPKSTYNEQLKTIIKEMDSCEENEVESRKHNGYITDDENVINHPNPNQSSSFKTEYSYSYVDYEREKFDIEKDMRRAVNFDRNEDELEDYAEELDFNEDTRISYSQEDLSKIKRFENHLLESRAKYLPSNYSDINFYSDNGKLFDRLFQKLLRFFELDSITTLLIKTRMKVINTLLLFVWC